MIVLGIELRHDLNELENVLISGRVVIGTGLLDSIIEDPQFFQAVDWVIQVIE